MKQKPDFEPPIKDFFILDLGGVPLFIRKYKEKEKVIVSPNDSDSVLFAGFLAAVEMFSRTHLEGNLQDIGLDDARYFFFRKDRNSDLFIVTSAANHENPELNNISHVAINHIMKKSSDVLEFLQETSASLSVDIKVLTENFGSFLDSIIMETMYTLNQPSLFVDQYENASRKLKEKSVDLDVQELSP